MRYPRGKPKNIWKYSIDWIDVKYYAEEIEGTSVLVA
jgi:hypothetical protein